MPALSPAAPLSPRHPPRPPPPLSYIYALPPSAAWLAIAAGLLVCAVGLRLRAARTRRARTPSRHGIAKGTAGMNEALLRSMGGGGGMDWEGKAGLPLPGAAPTEARNAGNAPRPVAQQQQQPQPATATTTTTTAPAELEEHSLDGPEYTWQPEPPAPAQSEAARDDGASIPRRRSYTKTQDGVAVQGEVVVGEAWRRHTRVYGGGVCLACLESENRMVGMGMKA